MKNFILKGDICYSKTINEICCSENSCLICENGKSAGVYREIPEKYKEYEVYDYSGKLIMPGFIDLHIHAPQFAFRGTGMDLELMEWLSVQAFAEEARYSDEEYACRAYGLFAQMLRKSVTTRACIFATCHVPATKILMDCMEESGIVSYVGKVNMDREAPDTLRESDAYQSADDTVKWLESISGKYKRTFPILTPRFIPSCTDELLSELHEIQEKYDLPVQSHLSENPDEIEWVRKNVPDSKFYGDAYDRYGLFGRGAKTVMAHCVYPVIDEVERMKENEVFVAHCPASNMNLSSGIAPVRKFIDNRIKTGLGTDIAGGHSISMFRAVTDAVQVSKLYYRLVDNTVKPLTFEEVFYLATKGGGEFFEKTGSFEEGYEFDAVVIDDGLYPLLEYMTVRKRAERVVYIDSEATGLEAKFVGGEKVV